jgi:hypothetical protein
VLFDFYGLSLETPRVTFFLWSPWRASALEHRLFEAIRQLPRTEAEQLAEEQRLHISDIKTARAALQAVARVLMGWQEDADPGSEKRSWRWLIETDTDGNGYDHTGEPFSLWAFLRLTLERGGLGEPEKGEEIDMEGFGLQVQANRGGK